MNKLRIKSKVILAIVLLTFVIYNCMPMYRAGADQLVGTSIGLGSPLTNTSFSSDAWDKWEIVAFGIFLSNFTYPLIDDYKSAFTNSSSGTKGSGFKALDFGTGADPKNNQILQNMLNYVISIQTDSNNLREIFVSYENMGVDETEGENKTEGSYKSATVNDLFPEKITNSLPVFCISTGASSTKSSKEVIFSFTDGWDLQMLAAWMSRVSLGDYAKKANSALDKMLENDEPIYLDALGNIVAMDGGRPCVVFPAASNQHLTKDGRYNFLTSVLFGGNYLPANGLTIVDKLEEETEQLWILPLGYGGLGSSGVTSGKSKKYIRPGTTIVIFDSNTLAAKSMRDYINNAGSEADLKTSSYGKSFLKVMSADINDKQTTMGFTVEVIGMDQLDGAHDRFKYLGDLCSVIAMLYPTDTNRDKLTYIKMRTGKELQLFDNPVTTGVRMKAVDDEQKNYTELIYRRYMNYIQQYISSGKTVSGNYGGGVLPTRNSLMSAINGQSTKEGLSNELTKDSEGHISPLMASFIEQNSNSKDPNAIFRKTSAKKSLLNVKLKNLEDGGYTLAKSGAKISSFTDMNDALERVIKAYPCNDTMRQATNVLGVRKGTEFGLMSPYIYITYLDFYGVTGGRYNKFNSQIFDAESDMLKLDINKVTAGSTLSEEEKKAKILDYSYMLLDPETGREYRSNMAMSGLSDWIYRTYQNIVYGKATEYHSKDTNLTSRYSAGFLSVDSYSSNFVTAWFMKGYSKYILVLIGIGMLLIIIVGIMTRRKAVWFLATSLMLVTITILTPAIGEITPYVSNNAVQNLFKDKMSYWIISESITNAALEKSSSQSMERIDKDETSVSNLVKSLSIAYLDRALMVKNDISKKVNETLGNYEDIQSMQSARWLLPTLIRQFSASDKSSDYLYVPLADVYDNVSNLYWMYKPSDALTVQTPAARDMSDNFNAEGVNNKTDLSTKQAYYIDYVDTSNASAMTDGKYSNTELGEEYTAGPGWESLSRLKDDSEVVHTGAYILKGVQIPSMEVNNVVGEGSDSNNKEVWDTYLSANSNNTELKESFLTLSNKIEQTAGMYDRNNPSTSMDECFGYLWYTESPFHYFYEVVKDTFEPGITVGTVVGEVQGIYADNRETIMHYRDTGKIRDFLDMQELITNVIPYMYKVQLLSGGRDGESGVIGSSDIVHYSLYGGMNKSWLFRSNWVTKVITSKSLTREAEVTDKDGNVYKIENPLDPSKYPSERPMVFSEAQMYANGLGEIDLCAVELKLLKVNEAVMNKWTLNLNYANISGMTTEVLYRQMATDAVIEFCKEFSPTNRINSKKALHPNGISLRSISFDSIMKMLMLNTTRDSSLIYGDTMRSIIDDSDTFSAILLLIGAFLCAYIVPLARNILMGILLFLGIYALMSNIMSSGQSKIRIMTAYVVNNVLFLAMTLGFYLVFAVIINSSYRDDVLNVNNTAFNVGVPTWIFLIVVAAGILYILGIFAISYVSIKHRNDLGFELYASMAGAAVGKISSAINRASGGKYGRAYSGNTVINNSSYKEMNVDGEKVVVNKQDREEYEDNLSDGYFGNEGYSNEEELFESTGESAKDRIEKEIKRGENM